MSIGRDILRDEAKKAYKDQTKGVVKKNRISFAKFFKEFKKFKSNKQLVDNKPEEDFDLGKVANVNTTMELNETKDK